MVGRLHMRCLLRDFVLEDRWLLGFRIEATMDAVRVERAIDTPRRAKDSV